MKIFLSSVSSQFKPCRDALASDLRAVGADVRVQEDFQQYGGTLLEKIEHYIASCDRVVALVGDAYGWEPEAEARPAGFPRRSYTQWEYFFAQGERLDGTTEPRKELFVYFATPDYLAANPAPSNDETAALQRAFADTVRQSGKDWNQFTTPNELRALVLRDGFRLTPLNPQLRDPKPAQTVQGNQNIAVQIVGDGNQVHVNAPCLSLVRYGALKVRDGEIIGHLYPRARAIPLYGRIDELSGLESWANSPAPISIRVQIGGGGSGKTRLAMELCDRLADSGWDAGFVTGRELDRFGSLQNLATWGWSKPTLIVVDYAAARTRPLKAWLSELASHPGSEGAPLRLLLLERHADPASGWWQEAFGLGGETTYALQSLLSPTQPVRLAPLAPAARRDVLNAMLATLGSAERLPELGQSPEFDNRLADLTWGGDPLYLMMAACRAHEAGLPSLLALNRVDLANAIANGERDRLAKQARGHGVREDVLIHMAAFVTLCGGTSWEAVAKVVPAELEALHCPNACAPRDVANALADALPNDEGGVAPIYPDAVGEAFVLNAWRDDKPGTEAVLRAWLVAQWAVVDSLIRCAQDFAVNDDTPPVSWLYAVLGQAQEVNELREMHLRLPLLSVALGRFSVRVANLVLQVACKLEGKAALSARASALNNSAIRLGAVGDREGSLALAHEAVGLYRDLAAKAPDTFRPDLAMSLNNLATAMNTMGDRKGALAPAREAVGLYHDLATEAPDTFRPDLAMSLSNLATIMGDVGDRKGALAPAREAVGLYIGLAAKAPDAFRPDLAMSLNNLANRLSDLGDWEGALAPAREAVDLYGVLAAKAPDAFRPNLAASLNNLATFMSTAGDRKGALAPARKAVALYRDLAAKAPDAFHPDLATSLSNLATVMSAVGDLEGALASARAAVEIRHDLAARAPDAFRPDLAMSLNNLANLMSAMGDREDALAPAREAVEILSPYFLTDPHAFAHWMGTIAVQYLKHCEASGVEPDLALLDPIAAQFQAMQPKE